MLSEPWARPLKARSRPAKIVIRVFMNQFVLIHGIFLCKCAFGRTGCRFVGQAEPARKESHSSLKKAHQANLKWNKSLALAGYFSGHATRRDLRRGTGRILESSLKTDMPILAGNRRTGRINRDERCGRSLKRIQIISVRRNPRS